MFSQRGVFPDVAVDNQTTTDALADVGTNISIGQGAQVLSGKGW
jgi:UDP-3-O-[3-hydroxymyristoyl] glucosamine N-acyltransferase